MPACTPRRHAVLSASLMTAIGFACASVEPRPVAQQVDPEMLPRCEAGAMGACAARCDAGDGESCRLLGLAYYRGVGVNQDRDRAAELFFAGCEASDPHSCTRLAWQTENLQYAAGLYQRACDSGDPNGCTMLGYAYEGGEGVPQDLRVASRLYRRGCDEGDPGGCASLGLMYERGRGLMSPDLPRAFELYSMACDTDSPVGCDALGSLFERGLGVEKDVIRALRLYRRACERGFAPSCKRIGRN